MSRVFDMSSQSNQKPRSNGEVKSSKSMLFRPDIQTSFTVGIFFVLTSLMNY